MRCCHLRPLCHDRELALALLEAELHLHLAEHAPSLIFIHAGVAVHRGRAIVIPGPPLSGETTLIAALVRASALYFSDEYAFLDEYGLVYPFPRPLSIRRDGAEDTRWLVEGLGGCQGNSAGAHRPSCGHTVSTGRAMEAAGSPPRPSLLALLSNTFQPETARHRLSQ